MSQRNDTVQSIALIIGSAFAAVFVTAFTIMATQGPAEQAPAQAETATVVVPPISASGYIVGRVGSAHEDKTGVSHSIVIAGPRTNRTASIVFAEPSLKVYPHRISDTPGDAGSQSGETKPDGKDR